MSLLCRIFGHALPKRGWWGDGLYGRVSGGYRDGIKRTHYRVELECPRCRKWWVSARFHGGKLGTADARIERLKGYAVHDDTCEDHGAYPGSCTCGLSRLLKEIGDG